MRHFKVLFFLILFLNGLGYANAFEKYGDATEKGLPISAALIALLHKDSAGLIQFAEAFATSMITVEVLKHAIDNERPDGGRHAFPSGHTASAFSSATFLQRRYGWRFGVPAYIAASLVGTSRIAAKRHWPRDVFAGAAIGILYNVIIVKPHPIKLIPYFNLNSAGVALNMNW